MAQQRCDHCGREFRATRFWQRFCSTKCRNNHHNHANSPLRFTDATARQEVWKRLDVVALPPKPKLGLLPLVKKEAEEAEEEQEQSQVA